MEEQQVTNLQDGDKIENAEEVATMQDEKSTTYDDEIKNLTDEISKLKAVNKQLTKERDEANNTILSQEQKEENQDIKDIMTDFLGGKNDN